MHRIILCSDQVHVGLILRSCSNHRAFASSCCKGISNFYWVSIVQKKYVSIYVYIQAKRHPQVRVEGADRRRVSSHVFFCVNNISSKSAIQRRSEPGPEFTDEPSVRMPHMHVADRSPLWWAIHAAGFGRCRPRAAVPLLALFGSTHR